MTAPDTRTLIRLPDPAVRVPNSNGTSVAWSPDGSLLAVGTITATPFLTLFKRTGLTLAQLPDPPHTPPSYVASLAWTPDGAYLAAEVAGHSIYLYKRVGDSLTYLCESTDPAGLWLGQVGVTQGSHIAWHSDGIHLAASGTSPGGRFFKRIGETELRLVQIYGGSGSGTDNAWIGDTLIHSSGFDVQTYHLAGDTLTFLASVDPGGLFYEIAISPDNQLVFVGRLPFGGPSLPPVLYSYAAGVLTYVRDITEMLSVAYGASWEPSGTHLAASVSGHLTLFRQDGTTFVPIELPAGSDSGGGGGSVGTGLSWTVHDGYTFLASVDGSGSATGFAWYYLGYPGLLRVKTVTHDWILPVVNDKPLSVNARAGWYLQSSSGVSLSMKLSDGSWQEVMKMELT